MVKTSSITKITDGVCILATTHLDPEGSPFKDYVKNEWAPLGIRAEQDSNVTSYIKGRKEYMRHPWAPLCERSNEFRNSNGIPYVLFPQAYYVDSVKADEIFASSGTIGDILGETCVTEYLASGTSLSDALSNWGTTTTVAGSVLNASSTNVGDSAGWLSHIEINNIPTYYGAPTTGYGNNGNILLDSNGDFSADASDFIVAVVDGVNVVKQVTALIHRGPGVHAPETADFSATNKKKWRDWISLHAEMGGGEPNVRRDIFGETPQLTTISNSLVQGEKYFSVLNISGKTFAYTPTEDGENISFFSPQTHRPVGTTAVGRGGGLNSMGGGSVSITVFHTGGPPIFPPESPTIMEKDGDTWRRHGFSTILLECISIPLPFGNALFAGDGFDILEDILIARLSDMSPPVGGYYGGSKPGGNRMPRWDGQLGIDNANRRGSVETPPTYDPGGSNKYWEGVSESSNGTAYEVNDTNGDPVVPPRNTQDVANDNLATCQALFDGTATDDGGCPVRFQTAIIPIIAMGTDCEESLGSNVHTPDAAITSAYKKFRDTTGVEDDYNVSGEHHTSYPATDTNNPNAKGPKGL